VNRRTLLLVLVALGAAAGIAIIASPVVCACTPPRLPPSPVDGIVVAVDTKSLGKVDAFSLRTAGGEVVALRIGVLENPTEFTPSHLTEHQATGAPVRAYYRLEQGAALVYRLEDAPGNPAPSPPKAS